MSLHLMIASLTGHSEGGPGGHRKGGREGWYHRYHLSTHGTAPHDYRGAAFSRNQHHHVHYPSERLSSSRAWKAPPKSKDQPVFVFGKCSLALLLLLLRYSSSASHQSASSLFPTVLITRSVFTSCSCCTPQLC